jgi:amidohydrolase
MDQLAEGLNHVVKGIAAIYDAEIELHANARIVAANPNPQAQQFMERAIIDTLGEDKCLPPVVTSGGEDFHFYSFKKSTLKTTMLGLGCDLKPGLHHPQMTFRREALLVGIEILAKTIMGTFDHFALQGEAESEYLATKN